MRELRTMTDEQTRRWRESVDAELQERSAVDADLEAFKIAASEESFSGRLRMAIHRGGVPLTLLMARTNVEWETLRAFLAGEGSLSSDAIDRIATTLRLDVSLTPAAGESSADILRSQD